MKIGYFADGPWGHKAFKKIISDRSLEVLFVTLRYDKRDAVLKQMAQENHIPVEVSPNINAEDFVNKMKAYETELFVSMSFNQIFREKMINLPRHRTINCHAGKLPFYRGRNILNWALINDEKEFGVTVHYVDEGIDTGDIILQETFSIIGNEKISINTARMVPGSRNYKNTVGQVVGKTENRFLVKRGDTILEVLEYTYEGKVKIGGRLSCCACTEKGEGITYLSYILYGFCEPWNGQRTGQRIVYRSIPGGIAGCA